MTRFRLALVASCGAALLAGSLPAAAQLEEVTVTAERRESSLQLVPVAITAYTADDLERFQINSVTDIDKFAPSLRVINNVASSNALNVNLRGSTEAGERSCSPSRASVCIRTASTAGWQLETCNSPISSESRSCAGPKGRCSAATPWLAPSTS